MKNVRIHFIGNAGTEDDLDELRHLPWEKGTVACTRHTWVWAIYCRLRDRGFPVTFSYKPLRGAINFIHGEIARFQLSRDDIRSYYFIGIRADFRPFPYARFEIVQNKQTSGGRRIFMPLFPQPGLLCREPTRKEVKNVCFSGRKENAINVTQLSSDLRVIGCEYVFKGPGEWQDMRNIDLLLGIRSFSKKSYNSKPPTKLFNAWLAGIPFIGGYDSAYCQVGEPDENYLRVSTYEELLRSVVRLKNDHVYYSKLVEAGRMAAQEYSSTRITAQWINLLETMIVPDFLNWSTGSIRMRLPADVSAFSFELIEKRIRNYRRNDRWC